MTANPYTPNSIKWHINDIKRRQKENIEYGVALELKGELQAWKSIEAAVEARRDERKEPIFNSDGDEDWWDCPYCDLSMYVELEAKAHVDRHSNERKEVYNELIGLPREGMGVAKHCGFCVGAGYGATKTQECQCCECLSKRLAKEKKGGKRGERR